MHAYLNYANIMWLVLIKLNWKISKANKNMLHVKYSTSLKLHHQLLNLNILNVYQIGIFQSVQFVHKNKKTLHIFQKLFGAACHAHATNFPLINFSVPRPFLKFHCLQHQLQVQFFGTIAFQKGKTKFITLCCLEKGLKKK